MSPPRADHRWDVSDGVYIELAVDDGGLTYVGYDWTTPSGGAYSAGFQPLDEFLREGAPAHLAMPADVAAAVRADVEGRLAGGRPMLSVSITVDPLARLTHASVELDDRPVLVRDFAESPAEVVVTRGTTVAGPHRIGWALFGEGPGGRFRLCGERALEVRGPGAALCIMVHARSGEVVVDAAVGPP